MTDPAAFRAQFPVLERLVVSQRRHRRPGAASRGARPRTQRIDLESSQGRCGRPYFDGADGARRASCARATPACSAAQPSELALTGSTTDGVNTVIAGLDLRAGDEVVTTDEEHPGLLAPLGRARAASWHHACGSSRGPSSPDAVSPSTRLIACSHVSWVSGRVMDVAALRATGVPVLLDAAQAIGAIPVDVRALGCDFYAASGQKWMCGPEGSGCLYVRPDRLDELLVPWPGYGSVADPAQALEFEPAEGTSRLDHGFPVGVGTPGRWRRSRCSRRPAGTGSTSGPRRSRRRSPNGSAERGLEVGPRGALDARGVEGRGSRGRGGAARRARFHRPLHPRVRSGPSIGRRVELRG